MKKRRSLQYIFFVLAAIICLMGGKIDNANGALNPNHFTADLNQLVLDGGSLVSAMQTLVLSLFSMSSQLANLQDSVEVYLNNVGDLYKTVATSTDNTSMSLTSEMLIPLETLSTITVDISRSLAVLSGTVVLLSGTTTAAILTASLDSMLRLSDDIGVMADRIIEKRVVGYGEWLLSNLPKNVPHRQWVFSIPKRLRIYFLFAPSRSCCRR